MNRRDFFKILGKAVVVSMAAKVAPQILVPAEAATSAGPTGVLGPS